MMQLKHLELLSKYSSLTDAGNASKFRYFFLFFLSINLFFSDIVCLCV